MNVSFEELIAAMPEFELFYDVNLKKRYCASGRRPARNLIGRASTICARSPHMTHGNGPAKA